MRECKQCGGCCCHLPGFFAPEVDAVADIADFLKKDKEEVEKCLVRDYRAPFGEEIWFWTPAMLDEKGNKVSAEDLFSYPERVEAAGSRGGHCIFFDQKTKLCSIHPVKPLGCRIYSCGNEENTTGRMYFEHFQGEGNIRRVNQAEWAEIWDFCCPKCEEDEASYTGEIEEDGEIKYHKVVCDNCGYYFWVY